MPIDLKVSLHAYRQHDDIKRGKLQLLCSGVDCNEQFLNAIGRIAVKRIPTYAFPKELIKIDRINPESGYHSSIPFNNDMMRGRIQNTPVMNVDPGISFLHEKYWKSVDYSAADRDIHENEKRLEVFFDAKNTSDEGNADNIVHITTNDAKIYIDNVLTTIYSRAYPLLIISLKPKEAFKCSMKAVLGVGLIDTCWDGCSNFCYDQETVPGKTILIFEAISQFNEFVLVSRALEYFRIRLKLIKDEIIRLYRLDENPRDRFQIIIKDEDHTLGEPINYEIQSHDDIIKSSVSRPSHLIRQIMIDVVAVKQTKLLNAISESIDNLLAKIDIFDQQFKTLKTLKVNDNRNVHIDGVLSNDTKKITKDDPNGSRKKSSKKTTKKS